MNIEPVIATILYSVIGVILFLAAYSFIAFLVKRKKYDLNDEIDNHNVAAGIAIAGMFIAIAIVISGVIQ